MSRTMKRWAQRVRRAFRPRVKSFDLVLDLQIDPKTGRMICSAAPVPERVHERYVEDHALVPERIEELGEAELRALVGVAERSGAAADWRSALVQLAHHRSTQASEILEELEARVPRKLHDYWELAYAESVGWLGLEYVRSEGGQPWILPAGSLLPTREPVQPTVSGDEPLPN